MLIFKSKRFHKWAQSEGLEDDLLKQAVAEIENGIYEANLGGNLFKKRIPRKGEGKRGGYRTLIACKIDKMAFYLYGFAKNERENIGTKEQEVFKRLAKYYLNLTTTQLKILLKSGEFIEVDR